MSYFLHSNKRRCYVCICCRHATAEAPVCASSSDLAFFNIACGISGILAGILLITFHFSKKQLDDNANSITTGHMIIIVSAIFCYFGIGSLVFNIHRFQRRWHFLLPVYWLLWFCWIDIPIGYLQWNILLFLETNPYLGACCRCKDRTGPIKKKEDYNTTIVDNQIITNVYTVRRGNIQTGVFLEPVTFQRDTITTVPRIPHDDHALYIPTEYSMKDSQSQNCNDNDDTTVTIKTVSGYIDEIENSKCNSNSDRNKQMRKGGIMACGVKEKADTDDTMVITIKREQETDV